MSFLTNAWYVGAFSSEIEHDATFARTLLGRSVTFYRSESEGLAALDSRCPHRFAPLHMGRVHHDGIACPYHGLRFNAQGQCIHNPHGNGEIPKAARVRSYPVEERDGLVWIWMGDPQRCNRANLPAYDQLHELPAQTFMSAYIHSKANSELMTDNIMDLSHADFLHPGSLSTGGEVTRLVPHIVENGDEVLVTWHWKAATVPPVFAAAVPPAQECDMILQVHWRPAALMYIRMEVRVSEGADPVEVRGCHLMTPETEHTTHYFFAGTRNYLVDDQKFTDMGRSQILYAFGQEDKPVIEAVQQAMGEQDLWSLKPVLLSGDAGAVRVRRKLRALLERESRPDGVALDVP
jgi:vanillate O-demethylase monooxygenase subunit